MLAIMCFCLCLSDVIMLLLFIMHLRYIDQANSIKLVSQIMKCRSSKLLPSFCHPRQ